MWLKVREISDLLAELPISTNSICRPYSSALGPFPEVSCGIVSVVSRKLAYCDTKRHEFQTWQLDTWHPGQKCEDFIIIRIAQTSGGFPIVCPFIEIKCFYFFFPKNIICNVNHCSANSFPHIYLTCLLSTADRKKPCGVSVNMSVSRKI